MSARVVVLKIPEGVDVSDGYHTFAELYDHRITLWMAICKLLAIDAWRSRKHSDGSVIDGWFVLGLFDDAGKQMTYHLPNEKWHACDFAETLDRAPDFDGHTSADVLARLRNL